MNPIGAAPQNGQPSSRLEVPPESDLFVRHYSRHLSTGCPDRFVPRKGQEAAATQPRPSTYRDDQSLAPEVPGDPRQTAWPCRYPFAAPQKPSPPVCVVLRPPRFPFAANVCVGFQEVGECIL